MRVSRSTGGWGFAAGDDGSGARLGQDLLRLVLHCNDSLAPHSDLTSAVLLEFGDTAPQLATFTQQASPGDFGQYDSRLFLRPRLAIRRPLRCANILFRPSKLDLMPSGLTVISQFVLLAVLALRCAACWTPVITTGSTRQRACTFWSNRNCPRPVGPARAIAIGNTTPPVLCLSLICLSPSRSAQTISHNSARHRPPQPTS